MQRKLLAALLLTIPGSVLAADLIVGTWKLNLDKSHFSPGPAPKNVTMRISEDGDWLDSKTDGVDETGKPITRSNRYKMDGGEYPYDGPQGKGTIRIKNIDDHHGTATLKVAGDNTLTQHSVISADGKTRTVTTTGTDAKGRTVNNTVVWERQ